MRSYEAARGYFGFIEFVGWAVIVLGGIAAFAGGANAPNFLAGIMIAMPGIALVGIGFFILVNTQTARAAVDSAEYGQQSLQISRNQLEVSKQLLKLAEARDTAPGYAEATKASDLQNISFDTDEPANVAQGTAPGAITHQYKGRMIEEKNGEFLFDGRGFFSLEYAQAAVDEKLGLRKIEAS